jgi:hypothetical protein
MLEKPIVRTISKHENALRFIELITTETTPTFGNQSSLTRLFNGFEDQLGHSIRVLDYNGPKADVDGWRPRSQEIGKVGVGLVVRRKRQEIEARNGDVRAPVFGLGNQGRTPGWNVSLGSWYFHNLQYSSR